MDRLLQVLPPSVDSWTKKKSQSASVTYFVSKLSVASPLAGTATGSTADWSTSSPVPL
jgi:hypothetical protein